MSNGVRMSQEQFDSITRRLGRAIDTAPIAVGPQAKPAKYRNTPTTDEDGVRHASKKQALRYRELGLQMKSGELVMLAREVRFRLPGGVEYVADHVTLSPRALQVIDTLVADGDMVIEDVKSDATRKNAVYCLKRRQMRECLGLSIKEV